MKICQSIWSYDFQKISLSSRIKLAMKHNFVGKLFANICKAAIPWPCSIYGYGPAESPDVSIWMKNTSFEGPLADVTYFR